MIAAILIINLVCRNSLLLKARELLTNGNILRMMNRSIYRPRSVNQSDYILIKLSLTPFGDLFQPSSDPPFLHLIRSDGSKDRTDHVIRVRLVTDQPISTAIFINCDINLW